MWKMFGHYMLIALGAFLVAAGFNSFIIPHELLSGGVSGISILVGYVTHMNIALLYFLFNLPIIIWGWFAIGKYFIYLSMASVLLTTWFLRILPIEATVQEPLIASVFGGVLIGLGSGLSLRVGGSTGGFDILGSIFTRKRDFPLGTTLFALNGAVILLLGYYGTWDLALSSMLSIFISGKVVDMIHVRHIKVTAFIVTHESDTMIARLMELQRGVTVINTRGAFSQEERSMLMTVTTRYELAELKRIIMDTDPRSFVNIVETVGIMGQFRKS